MRHHVVKGMVDVFIEVGGEADKKEKNNEVRKTKPVRPSLLGARSVHCPCPTLPLPIHYPTSHNLTPNFSIQLTVHTGSDSY